MCLYYGDVQSAQADIRASEHKADLLFIVKYRKVIYWFHSDINIAISTVFYCAAAVFAPKVTATTVARDATLMSLSGRYRYQAVQFCACFINNSSSVLK